MWNQNRSVLLFLVAVFVFYACGQETATRQHDYPVAKQNYTLVADLAHAVLLTPEAGDQIIANNRNLFDSRFYEALNNRIRFFETHAARHYEYCNLYRREPRANQQCYQENEPAKNMHYLQTLNDATRNITPWSRSLVGQASVIGKQAVGAELWEALINAQFAETRHLFIVE